MLKLREGSISELNRFYSAMQVDFDERELFPLSSIRKAVRNGAQEFLLFYDEETFLTMGYAICCTKSVYGYVLLKYFGILPWYRDHGVGVEAMRLLHKHYADRQGILTELTVFEDSDEGDYLSYQCRLPDGRLMFSGAKHPDKTKDTGRKWLLCLNPDGTKGWEYIAPVEEASTICCVTVKVPEDAKPGAMFTLKFDDLRICDYAMTTYSADVQDGCVKVQG